MIAPGDLAPAFTLPDHDGTPVSLRDFRGRYVVLYFYPEDDTLLCTRQACDFRDHWETLQKAGAVVLGVSPDPVDSHRRFRAKHRLPFTLLADVDHDVATRYGAWAEKRLYGRTFVGMHRNTYLIDPAGRIAAVFPRIRTRGHAARVLAAIPK